MLIYASIVTSSLGDVDVEFLDAAPTPSFYEGLDEAVAEGRVASYQVREGYINGGDSIIVKEG